MISSGMVEESKEKKTKQRNQREGGKHHIACLRYRLSESVLHSERPNPFDCGSTNDLRHLQLPLVSATLVLNGRPLDVPFLSDMELSSHLYYRQ